MSITCIPSWIHRKLITFFFVPLCSLVALLGRLLQQTYVDLIIHPEERRKACYFSMAAQTTEKSLSDVGSPFFLSLSFCLIRPRVGSGAKRDLGAHASTTPGSGRSRRSTIKTGVRSNGNGDILSIQDTQNKTERDIRHF